MRNTHEAGTGFGNDGVKFSRSYASVYHKIFLHHGDSWGLPVCTQFQFQFVLSLSRSRGNTFHHRRKTLPEWNLLNFLVVVARRRKLLFMDGFTENSSSEECRISELFPKGVKRYIFYGWEVVKNITYPYACSFVHNSQVVRGRRKLAGREDKWKRTLPPPPNGI